MIANNKAVIPVMEVTGQGAGSNQKCGTRGVTIMEVARRPRKIKENLPSRSTEAYA
jgi:hypothetical protein